jgi:hypothetical protein
MKNWKDSFCLMWEALFKVWPATLLLVVYYAFSYPIGIYLQAVMDANNNHLVFSGFLIALIEVVIYIFLLTVFVSSIYQVGVKKRTKFADLLKMALARVLPVLAVYLFLFLLVFVIALIVTAAFLVHNTLGTIILLPIVLLAIYFFPICFLVFVSVVIDQDGPWQAIKNSVALIWGNWWHIVFSFLPVSVLAIPFAFLLASFGGFNYLAWIINIIWGVIYCFSLVAFVLVIFNDAKQQVKPMRFFKRK